MRHLRKGLLALHALATAWLFFTVDPISYPDTKGYRAVANLPWTARELWLGERPPVFPIALKLTSESAVLVVSQLVLYWAASVALALSWSALFRTRKLGDACLALLLALTLCTTPFDWFASLSSESLSLSLFYFGLALGLNILRAPSPAAWVAFAVDLLAWVFVRDADIYLGICLALAALALGFRRFARRLLAITLAGLLLAAFVGRVSQAQQRWNWPLVNIIGQRVLPHPERRAWFAARGMPINDKVMCLSGRWGYNCNNDLSGFGSWLDENRKPLYARYLLSHPEALLVEPVDRGLELICTSREKTALKNVLLFYFHARPPFWQYALDLVLFVSFFPLAIALSTFVMLIAIALARRRFGPRLFAPTSLFVACWGMALFVWHADAAEMMRHALLPIVALRIALITGILLAIEHLRTGDSPG